MAEIPKRFASTLIQMKNYKKYELYYYKKSHLYLQDNQEIQPLLLDPIENSGWEAMSLTHIKT